MVVLAAQVSKGERKETEEKRGNISTACQLTLLLCYCIRLLAGIDGASVFPVIDRLID